MKKNENVRELSKFAQKKGMLDILEQTFSYVMSLKNDCCKTYRIVGKEAEQAKDRDGNLRWADEAQTIPYYRDRWDYVDVPIEEMDDDTYAKFKACEILLSRLDDMV